MNQFQIVLATPRQLTLPLRRHRLLHLHHILLQPVEIRLQLVHRILVNLLLLSCLGEVRLELHNCVSLALDTLEPTLHQFDLDLALLLRLLLLANLPRKLLQLFGHLHSLALGFDVDRRGGFDLVDTNDPGRDAGDCRC